MNKVKIVALGMTLTLLFASMLLFFHSSQFSSSESLTTVQKAVDFLVNSQFNESIGLCCEAPKVLPNTYWVVSDNLWAWKALNMAYESGLTNAAQAEVTADKIKAKLAELAVNYNLPMDSNGLPRSYAHEAVIGDVASPPYSSSVNCTLYNGYYVLNTTMYNGTVMPNWNQYADLLLYAALSCHWQDNDSGALGYCNYAAQMWNETSQGLQDNAFNGTYSTYKLALLLYASKLLGQNLPFDSELVDRIDAQQRESDGGIITDYYGNGTSKDGADANTETTSIVIIALLTPPKVRLGIFAFYYPWYETPSVSGNWSHWNSEDNEPYHNCDSFIAPGRRDIAAVDYPLMKVYDSSNENVVENQIELAKEAGIDCFVISWWGGGDFTETASKIIRHACEQKNFNFSFYLESSTNVAQAVADIKFLLNEYGSSSSLYRIDGRPVIFVYSRVRDYLSPQGWNSTISALRGNGYNPYIIMDFGKGGYEDNLENFIGNFSGCIDGIHIYMPENLTDLTKLKSIYDNAAELAHSNNLSFIATVFPSFDNTAINSRCIKIPRNNGTYYTCIWQIAKASSPDGYVITSFNEWREGTEIEPSIQYQYQYVSWTFIEFLTLHFNSIRGSSDWKGNADLNGDGVVNMRDIASAIFHFDNPNWTS